MSIRVWEKVDRLWCYRVLREADLFEEREYADGVIPGPGAPYIVRRWRCDLEESCQRQGIRCRLELPNRPGP